MYINDDNIPELIIDGQNADDGAYVYTYFNGEVDSYYLSHSDYLYYPGQNIIDNASGWMGAYGNDVISIQNGKFVSLGSGYYHSPSLESDPAIEDCVFYWNDREVTSDEYLNHLGELLPEDGITHTIFGSSNLTQYGPPDDYGLEAFG